MPQKSVWEKEYQKPQLVSKDDRPQNFLVQFVKYLKKELGHSLMNLQILDLGCGTGRNSNYLAQMGNQVIGIDIAPSALKIAEERAKKLGLAQDVKYLKQSIGQTWPFPNDNFDLILDITSSNSLNNSEREMYLQECYRVLKPGGFIILRALCKDGDQNAKKLLASSPGREADTYIIKELGLSERVFSEIDLKKLYSQFVFKKLIKDVGYPQMNGRTYKRKYWLAILNKKPDAR
jgi:ubiquinone/menaquinone biosynthesis C-methylase UbiE